MRGVCLGMQVMLEWSDENGGVPALGLFPGRVSRFPDPPEDGSLNRLKVPHMGWNRVRQTQPHALWKGVPDDSWFYFVHSYHAVPSNPAHVLGSTEYGTDFASRSEEHTSELQSLMRTSYAVFCLKKKTTKQH